MITREEVLKYYNKRCIRCKHPAVVVHEIQPISKRPKDWWQLENRVALCVECHEWAHSRGASTSAPELKKLRDEYVNNRRTEIGIV